MICERCNHEIDSGEEREHTGQTFCEDCYMEVLSPIRACDPWAVHSAKTLEKHCGTAQPLTPIQEEILDVLKQSGGIEPARLAEELGNKLSFEELQREFAALRHMEKARGEKRDDRVLWRLW